MPGVLITGGAGFIGSNLVRHLVEKRPDWQLAVADLLTYAGNVENIADLVKSGKVAFEKVDIADPKKIEDLFERRKFEVVFHLAAESHVDRSINSAIEFVRTNVIGTQVLLNAARSHGVRRFIHVSTDEVYGSLGPTGSFVESTPLDPTSPYAASKAASDLMVLSFCKTHAFPAIVTRCTNNYGPYQFPEKFIPLFVTNAMEDKPLPLYGDGMNVRSWIHVRDHCEALLAVAEQGKVGEVYNIGGGIESEMPNLEVAKIILGALDKPFSLIKLVADRLAHDKRYSIDHSKISKQLGWKPQVNFAQGLGETIGWYVKNRQWWERIKSGEYNSYYDKHYGDRLRA